MIGSALERGSLIYVYDEHGRMLFAKTKGGGPKDGLLGFTGSTVTARYGSLIYTYDEHGQTLYAKGGLTTLATPTNSRSGGQPGQGALSRDS